MPGHSAGQIGLRLVIGFNESILDPDPASEPKQVLDHLTNHCVDRGSSGSWQPRLTREDRSRCQARSLRPWHGAAAWPQFPVLLEWAT
jgi:hypothetical protein